MAETRTILEANKIHAQNNFKKIEKIFLEGNPTPKQIEMFEEMAEVILKGR